MKTKKTLGVAGLAAAATMMIAAPAMALATTHVSVNGDSTTQQDVLVNGTNDGNLHFETNILGTEMDCSSSSVDGYVKQGAAVTQGTTIGKIKNLSFSSCTATSLNYPVVVTDNIPAPATGNPDPGWPIIVASTPANAGDPVDITIEGVSAYMHSTGSAPWACELDAETPAGVGVDGTFYPGTTANGHDGRIVIDTPSSMTDPFPLDITTYDGSGSDPHVPGDPTCGVIYDAEFASMTGAFELDTVSPVTGPISHN